ncbi:hypothetical protein QR680_015636 [Steinernema hermaphroditum]|uniref:G-protein coupled receptors family 1 profile domain-containing protein n=1 Tax=Steinernema hermaphroditum TaxID=289476 RepID=A0AA39LKY9_9BILA|nr:hypothetical protein QR680_015636 [Steinernema hermaphroditum]
MFVILGKAVHMSTMELSLIGGLYILLSFVFLLVNTLLFVTLFKNKEYQTSTYRIIRCICLACMVQLTVQLTGGAITIVQYLDEQANKILGAILQAGWFLYMFLSVALAVDRLLYFIKISSRKFRIISFIILTVSWTFAAAYLAIFLVPGFGFEYCCVPSYLHWYYTTEHGAEILEKLEIIVDFTIVAIAIIMLIVMSFFGKRVRLSAWMFHTVNVSAWNALQLVNFAVVANDTPIPDFIKDQSFLNRSKEIQAGTLTMFAAGMIFLLPYHCLCYAFPHVSSNRFVTWLGWIPILLGINILVVILFTKRDFKDFFGPKPLDVYLFYVNSIYTFVFLTFCIAVMAAIVVYTCKLSIFFTRRDRKPDSDVNISSITFDLMNLIALVPYAYIIWIMGLFVNLFGFMGYTMRVISIDANILAEFAKYIPQSYIDYVMFMMKNDEYLQLFLPSVQLVLTCVAIPDYREQVCVLWCHETKYFR